MDGVREIYSQEIRNLVKRLNIPKEDLYPSFDQPKSYVPSLAEDMYSFNEGKGCVLILSNSFRGNAALNRKQASINDVKSMIYLWREEIKCDLFDICKADKENDRQWSSKATGEEANRKKIRQSIIDKSKQASKEADEGAYVDMTAVQMDELLQSFSEMKISYDYVVVVISSHGSMMTESEIRQHEKNAQTGPGNKSKDVVEAKAQVFLGEDEKPVREKEMIKLFYNNKNPMLKNIPKFFILNYCRCEIQAQSLGDPDLSSVIEEPRLPLISDMIICSATHRNFRAFQYEYGSWLILAIASVFRKEFTKKDVVSMRTKVNRVVMEFVTTHAHIQKIEPASVFESSLVKEFWLWKKTADGGDGSTF